MSESFKSTIVLTLVCLGAGFLVMFFHSSFASAVDKTLEKKQRLLVERMFTDQADIIPISGKKPLPSCYWVGKKDSLVIGYAFPIETRHYAGDFSTIVGIDTAGTILGMFIVSESRTPGIGISLTDRLSLKTLREGIFKKKNAASSWFTEQFKGTQVNKPFFIDTSARNLSFSDAKKNENRDGNIVCSVAGATVSTRAIVRSIEKDAASFFAIAKETSR
jgi:Na+-translocating ferredoxin:NAD+ oxidoreductase RnfG subunit